MDHSRGLKDNRQKDLGPTHEKIIQFNAQNVNFIQVGAQSNPANPLGGPPQVVSQNNSGEKQQNLQRFD